MAKKRIGYGDLYCTNCGSRRDAREDYCGRCGCRMLKAGVPVAAAEAEQKNGRPFGRTNRRLRPRMGTPHASVPSAAPRLYPARNSARTAGRKSDDR